MKEVGAVSIGILLIEKEDLGLRTRYCISLSPVCPPGTNIQTERKRSLPNLARLLPIRLSFIDSVILTDPSIMSRVGDCCITTDPPALGANHSVPLP